LGEHLLCKQGVVGSIPISSTRRWPVLENDGVRGCRSRQTAAASADLNGPRKFIDN
jgi:hypothetical protein